VTDQISCADALATAYRTRTINQQLWAV